MVNLTTHKLRLIGGKRGIKNYQNMSIEKLLSTLDESDLIELQKCRIFHKMNLSKSQKCEIYCKMN